MFKNISEEEYYKFKREAYCIKEKLYSNLCNTNDKIYHERFIKSSKVNSEINKLRFNNQYSNKELALIEANIYISDDLNFYNKMIEFNDDFEKIFNYYVNLDECITEDIVLFKLNEINNFSYLMFDNDFPNQKCKKIYN